MSLRGGIKWVGRVAEEEEKKEEEEREDEEERKKEKEEVLPSHTQYTSFHE